MPEFNFEQLEKNLGITFNNRELLKNALIHRSFLNENPQILQSNERLEFLGDAVLEFIVSEILFKQFSKEDEGHLTVLRSRLVNTTSLAATARQLDLGAMLFLSRGEEKSGGRENTSLLADTVEAILGAIYLDQGIDGAYVFVNSFIVTKIPEIVKKSLKDAKSLLQEYVQANGHSAPVYKTVTENGPDHAKTFTVEVQVDRKPYAQGEGTSKQIAAQNAAQNALDRWTRENSS
jgi:ribonuclease III